MGTVVNMVDPETVKQWIDEDKAVVVDVREPMEYQDAHIAGSTLVPLSVFSADQIPEVPEGKKLVFHCRSGQRCGMAAGQLSQQAWDGEVNRMAGGIIAWSKAGYPVERG